MRTLEIKVTDSDYSIVRSLLENLNYIKAIKDKEKDAVDEVTLLSQQSLAEDWDSEEDDRYDELYRAKIEGFTK